MSGIWRIRAVFLLNNHNLLTSGTGQQRTKLILPDLGVIPSGSPLLTTTFLGARAALLAFIAQTCSKETA